MDNQQGWYFDGAENEVVYPALKVAQVVTLLQLVNTFIDMVPQGYFEGDEDYTASLFEALFESIEPYQTQRNEDGS